MDISKQNPLLIIAALIVLVIIGCLVASVLLGVWDFYQQIQKPFLVPA